MPARRQGPDEPGDRPPGRRPDYGSAVHYALGRVEAGLASRLTYHNLSHTADDVLPAVRRLATLSGLGPDETGLLEVAAAYHDLGYVVFYAEHERAGIDLVVRVLPDFGFDDEQIAIIKRLILATEVAHTPESLLEEIMADADLDVLGRDDFLAHSRALRAERDAMGSPVSEVAWYREQVRFLREHRYYSAAARSLRDEGKCKNIALVELLLAEAEANGKGPAAPLTGLEWLIKE